MLLVGPIVPASRLPSMATFGQQGLVLGQDVLSRGDVTLVQIHHGGEAM